VSKQPIHTDSAPAAIGVAQLPKGAAVELDAIVVA
jgi:hypothetical protein